MNKEKETSLIQAMRVTQLIVDKTHCPDPVDGGCIGGIIPGYGCIHEASSFVLRRLQEVVAK